MRFLGKDPNNLWDFGFDTEANPGIQYSGRFRA
jgi:hypothetical protein